MTIKEVLQAIKDLLSKVHNCDDCDANCAAKDTEIAALKAERDEAVALATEIKAELEALVGGFTPSGN